MPRRRLARKPVKKTATVKVSDTPGSKLIEGSITPNPAIMARASVVLVRDPKLKGPKKDQDYLVFGIRQASMPNEYVTVNLRKSQRRRFATLAKGFPVASDIREAHNMLADALVD